MRTPIYRYASFLQSARVCKGINAARGKNEKGEREKELERDAVIGRGATAI